jgi:urease alpha subunit
MHVSQVLREGMGQATGVPPDQQLDTVITNALIVDASGIYKADIGIKAGLISGIGKAGNPDVMAGVSDGMVVGVNTEVRPPPPHHQACQGPTTLVPLLRFLSQRVRWWPAKG